MNALTTTGTQDDMQHIGVFRCPTTAGPNHSDILGCGRIFPAEFTARDPQIDCPFCGIDFPVAEPGVRSEPAGTHTRELLERAFSCVSDPDDRWLPIAAVIAPGDEDVVKNAIAYFTGSTASFAPYTGQPYTASAFNPVSIDGVSIFVSAPGYAATHLDCPAEIARIASGQHEATGDSLQ